MIFSFNITLHCIEKIKSNKFEEYTKLDEKIGVEDYIEKFKKESHLKLTAKRNANKQKR